jgi:hypothetical protein
MKKLSLFQILNIFFTLLTLTVNGLANALPFNGKGTGEISDQFPIYFVPAGYVFTIWGLIFLSLLVFTIFQAMGAQSDNKTIERISPWYWLGSVANSGWMFLWHYEIFSLTLFAMVALLISLIAIYLELKTATLSTAEVYLVKLPFSIYLGWISVATIANVSQVLYYFEWSGWGITPVAWAAIMLGVASVLGIVMVIGEKDLAFGLVLIWAFVGIAIQHVHTSLVSNTAMVTSAILVIGVFSAGILSLRR